MIIYDFEQGSEEWKKIRIGKVTGTRLKNLCGKDNLSLIDELIAEKVTEEIPEFYVNEKMQRGTDLEPIAADVYEQYTGLKLVKLGFCESEEFPWFGQSPDRYVEGTNLTHAIEIKCPDSDTHVRYIRMNVFPSEYKHQKLSYFIVNPELQRLDFVSYDNRFSIRPIFIKTILREDILEEIEEVKSQMAKFQEKFYKYYNELTF